MGHSYTREASKSAEPDGPTGRQVSIPTHEPRCRVCTSDLREVIEALVLQGKSFEAIAKQINVDGRGRKLDRRSVSVHQRKHMGMAMPIAQMRAARLRPEPIQEIVVGDISLADKVLPNAHVREVTYFVQGRDGGPIKIGRSTTKGLKARVSSLQTSSPSPLVLRYLALGNFERDLHLYFAPYRLNGEWFRAVPALAVPIGAIPEHGC